MCNKNSLFDICLSGYAVLSSQSFRSIFSVSLSSFISQWHYSQKVDILGKMIILYLCFSYFCNQQHSKTVVCCNIVLIADNSYSNMKLDFILKCIWMMWRAPCSKFVLQRCFLPTHIDIESLITWSKSHCNSPIELLFLICIYCLANQKLEKLAFSQKSVTSWLFITNGGIKGIFLPL